MNVFPTQYCPHGVPIDRIWVCTNCLRATSGNGTTLTFHWETDWKARAEAVERELQEVKQDRTLQGEESDREIHEMQAERDAAREALRAVAWYADRMDTAILGEERREKVRRALEGA